MSFVVCRRRVAEVGRRIGDQRIIVGDREADRDVVPARDLDDLPCDEGLVSDFQHVPQPHAVTLVRQARAERLDLVRVEFLGSGELPQDRSELRPQLGHSARQEARDGLGAVGEVLAVDREAVGLDGEDEVVGRLRGPLLVRRRALRAVEGGVDLDRRHLPTREAQLLRLSQLFGIEGLAPGLEAPAADADLDRARLRRVFGHVRFRSCPNSERIR